MMAFLEVLYLGEARGELLPWRDFDRGMLPCPQFVLRRSGVTSHIGSDCRKSPAASKQFECNYELHLKHLRTIKSHESLRVNISGSLGAISVPLGLQTFEGGMVET